MLGTVSRAIPLSDINLQREAVLGPDAPPHPLHIAEEHDDAEECEVAGDTHKGAGHREVVQQVPEPSEVGMNAEGSSVQLDALAVDLDNRSSCWHIRILPIVGVEFYLQELLLLSKAKEQEAGEHQCVKYLEQLGSVMQHHRAGRCRDDSATSGIA